MRKEDLKNWTRDMLKDRIIELGGIIEQWKRDNREMLQIMKKTQNENNELRKILEKLESDICGTSPCIVSEFHSFEGESWIRATTYDDVLLRLKKANERIEDLEKNKFNKSMDELKRIEKLSSENKSLKQHIKDMEDVCDGSCFSDEEDERDKLIADLQDQHQQDCIRINDLTTTVHVLARLYSTLRKNVGMD